MIHMTTTEVSLAGEWRAYCRCGWLSPFVAYQSSARNVGDQHLAVANASGGVA